MNAVPASAREYAARAVVRVFEQGTTLDAALQAVLAEAPAELVPAVRSLSFGAVRGFHRHEAILQRLLSQPVKALDAAVRAVLSVALFEIEDARTPEYAVVDAAVRTVKSSEAARAAGLVNAVLRRYLRERAGIDAALARDPARRHASPAWLAERFRADWPSRWTEILAASDTHAPMWLRVNRRHSSGEEYLQSLERAGIAARLEPRVPQALVLESPRDVGDLPGFAQGVVSVQDLGAQCVAFPLRLEPGLKVLDACAAPGGKTLLMAEREPELARLTAVDVDAARLERVRGNLERAGLHADLRAGDAAAPAGWWDGVQYDRILVDAPCSALGVIRRHPDIRLRRSPRDIDALPQLQGRLLKACWQMLARGGILVYSTCTVTRSENGAVISAFLADAPDAAVVRARDWAGWPGLGEEDGFGRQILPGEAGADGFYYAAVIKQ